MPAWLQRLMDILRHGAGQPFILFLTLAACMVLITFAWNRGFRAADRGPVLQPVLLALAFGTALLLNHMKEQVTAAIIVGVAMIVSALVARSDRTRAPWIPVMLLACLFGLGLKLSGIAFTLSCVLLFGLSPVTKR